MSDLQDSNVNRDNKDDIDTEEKITRAFNTEDKEDEESSENNESEESNESENEDSEYKQTKQSLSHSLSSENKKNKLWFSLFLTTLGVLASIFVVPFAIRHFSEYFKLDNKKAEVVNNSEHEKQETPLFDNFDRPTSRAIQQDEDKEDQQENQEEDVDHESESNNKQLFLQNISLSKSSATSESNSESSTDEDDKLAAERDNAEIEKKGDEMIARLTATDKTEQQTATLTSKKNTISQDRYNTEQYITASATKLRLDPDLSLQQGTFIPCVLQTKIVSTIAGEVTCMLSDDVYSHSGNVILLEKGSKVFGTFSSGQLQNGENRIFVIWQKIRTPNNIEINISSNATDELGSSGINGWVNNHFAKKFGAALMVSAIAKFLTTASENAANRAVKPSQTQIIKRKNNADEQVTSITNSILQKEMNIEPTLYRNQGDIVGILIARDLDFSQVYTLKLKHHDDY